MVNDFGEAIAALVAQPETRKIAQPKEFNATNMYIGKGQHHIAK